MSTDSLRLRGERDKTGKQSPHPPQNPRKKENLDPEDKAFKKSIGVRKRGKERGNGRIREKHCLGKRKNVFTLGISKEKPSKD